MKSRSLWLTPPYAVYKTGPAAPILECTVASDYRYYAHFCGNFGTLSPMANFKSAHATFF